MSSNYISTLISLGKSAKGAYTTRDPVKIATTVGYTAKLVEKTAKLADTTAGDFATELIETFAKATDSSHFGKIAKGTLAVAKNTDGIKMACSAVKTVKSDSPARTFLKEACGWTGRFICKDLILTHGSKLLNIKGVKPISDAITKFSKNTKGFGQVPNIIEGVTYTFAKEVGKKGGKAIGTFIADKLGLAPEKQTLDPNSKKSPREQLNAPLR